MPANLVEPANSLETCRKGILRCHKPAHQKAVLSQFEPICFQSGFLDEQALTCYNINCSIPILSLHLFSASCHVFLNTGGSLLEGRRKANFARLITRIPFLGEVNSSWGAGSGEQLIIWQRLWGLKNIDDIPGNWSSSGKGGKAEETLDWRPSCAEPKAVLGGTEGIWTFFLTTPLLILCWALSPLHRASA